LNGTLQLLVYAVADDEGNTMVENTNTIKTQNV
jgi:hypothetical protein